jgi:hypothetical protein
MRALIAEPLAPLVNGLFDPPTIATRVSLYDEVEGFA